MKFLKIQHNSPRPVIDIIFAREIPDSDYCVLTFDENETVHYFAGYEEDQKVIQLVLNEKGIQNDEIDENSLRQLSPSGRYSLFGNRNLLPIPISGV